VAKKPKDDGGKPSDTQTVVAGSGAGANVPTAPANAKPYVVLARKYRPMTFDDMIGQDALVQTLRNAFKAGRIAQGYMLTGVRGIGKTTTARILARALNYQTDTIDVPTVDMPALGHHCAEIIDSRHPDIFEMDAASNTSIDDIREIIENARYKPLSARYKVFIIDEVHMLSKNAFNGLLKTLEEPPEHVKFIFATTEIRKVPVTVLSRCQRFDLRRIDVPVLMKLFHKILGEEGAGAEDEAVRLIARAAEGSARDGLSILDQSIAMGSGEVKAADVRAMLGLADRSRIFDLLELTFAGKPAAALQAFAKLHSDGADPLQVLADLSEAVHLTTRTKIVGANAAGESLSNEERQRASMLSGQVSVPLLARAWQMLIKGLEEAGKAGSAASAVEMILVRLAYTADLPTPDELIRTLGGAPLKTGIAAPTQASGPAGKGPLNTAPTPTRSRSSIDHEPPPVMSVEDYGDASPPDSFFAPPEDDDQEFAEDIGTAIAPIPEAPLRSFQDVVNLIGRRRDARLKVHLEENVSLVRFDALQGLIDIHLLPNAPKEIANDLRERLNAWTSRKWMVAVASRPGERTIGDVHREAAARELEQLKQHPAVAEVLRQIPQAKISKITPLQQPTTTDETGTG
jgi:DNA polymerase III subunit gamma/tau